MSKRRTPRESAPTCSLKVGRVNKRGLVSVSLSGQVPAELAELITEVSLAANGAELAPVLEIMSALADVLVQRRTQPR